MDVFQAAYRVAHDFAGGSAKRGGAVKLAEKMGENPGTFLNRLNPETEHKLYLSTAVNMSVVSGDHRILYALAATLDEVCFKLPTLAHVSDAALLELVCKIGAEGGDFMREINSGLDEKRFTRASYEKIRTEGLEYIAAIAETIERLKGMLDE